MKEEAVERRVPQVKAMYVYKGQGMEVAKGEVSLYYLELLEEKKLIHKLSKHIK